MSKLQLGIRLLGFDAGIDASKLRSGFLRDDDWGKLLDAANRLSELPIFIDDSSGIGVLEMKAKCRRLKKKNDLTLVIVDYLQLIQGRRTAESRQLEISEISRSLKALAKELNVPVMALSQLNRKVEDRQDKRPQLADLRESGAIEQDADVIAFIYRDEVYNPYVEKNRNVARSSSQSSEMAPRTRSSSPFKGTSPGSGTISLTKAPSAEGTQGKAYSGQRSAFSNTFFFLVLADSGQLIADRVTNEDPGYREDIRQDHRP